MDNDREYYLYLLLCDQKIIYTGIAIDPSSRLQQHQNHHPASAKFTRRFNQIDLAYQVKVGSRSMAQSLEYQVKKLKKITKLKVIEQQPTINQLLKQLPAKK